MGVFGLAKKGLGLLGKKKKFSSAGLDQPVITGVKPTKGQNKTNVFKIKRDIKSIKKSFEEIAERNKQTREIIKRIKGK